MHTKLKGLCKAIRENETGMEKFLKEKKKRPHHGKKWKKGKKKEKETTLRSARCSVIERGGGRSVPTGQKKKKGKNFRTGIDARKKKNGFGRPNDKKVPGTPHQGSYLPSKGRSLLCSEKRRK